MIKALDDEAHKKALSEYHEKVLREAFPEPRHDQESEVGHLMKRMLINRLVIESFNAGWTAAGKKVP